MSASLRVLVLDDEPPALDELAWLLRRDPRIGEVHACDNPADALRMLRETEVDAVFHIHGYDESVPATQVAAGATTTITFTAQRAGQFPIEIHPGDDPRGVEVGILTVHAS